MNVCIIECNVNLINLKLDKLMISVSFEVFYLQIAE
jgi:hypothetical protein